MDIIQEIIAALAARSGKQSLSDIERQVRERWGGERVYIAKECTARSERDALILREWHRGDRVSIIARRHGISVRRVRQIISIARSGHS